MEFGPCGAMPWVERTESLSPLHYHHGYGINNSENKFLKAKELKVQREIE